MLKLFAWSAVWDRFLCRALGETAFRDAVSNTKELSCFASLNKVYVVSRGKTGRQNALDVKGGKTARELHGTRTMDSGTMSTRQAIEYNALIDL